MSVDRLDLPTRYTVVSVIGKTEGNGFRPSVYFNDGSHFTQSHKRADNIGYHAPPATGHAFFGNVSNATLDAKWNDICRDPTITNKQAAFDAYLCSTFDSRGGDTRIRIVRKSNVSTIRNPKLIEVMILPNGRLYCHESRSPLIYVNNIEAMHLIRDITGRSKKICDGADKKLVNGNNEYYFLDKT